MAYPNQYPPTACISNQETGEILRFQFNPPEFTESIAVNYAKHTVPGLGYQLLQYINTNNNSITLAIYMSIIADKGEYEAPSPLMAEVWGDLKAFDLHKAKAFLQSLLYPVRGEAGGWRAPPTLLFVWPKVVRMTCVATALNFNHSRFSSENLETLALTAELTLESIRSKQLFSDFVRHQGSRTSVHHVRISKERSYAAPFE
ncbi:unnamed protein product [marine sediment metagenome]|uniref:Uncharacterized protein n=1 Tax=marine sediment metagenome TaxID=412755 RepID=X1I5C7_9ZZZZ